MKIPFNRPFLTGKETEYIVEAISDGRISGNGAFTRKCHQFFEERYRFPKVLMTTSCTDALEMVALLLELKPGDEVIVPSFTFVSTANAFCLHGAKVVFADSGSGHPNVTAQSIERCITPRTKACVVVHYSGTACEMDEIVELTQKHKIALIEDAAHGIDADYKGTPLGSFGQFATFSFHETKNVICGEGGMLVINDSSFSRRAEIIWEKGTNRCAFSRKEVDKYEWIDLGSSFLPSELCTAFLLAQLENIDLIQNQRTSLWKQYYALLEPILSGQSISLPYQPSYASINGHLFYLLCESKTQREALDKYLNGRGVNAVFHYLALHKSPYYQKHFESFDLPNAEKFSDCLLRLPLYFHMTDSDVTYAVECVQDFLKDWSD